MKKLLSHFYNIQPSIVQNIILSVYGLLNDYRRYGGNYNQIEKDCLERGNWTELELKKYQKQKLKSHLLTASKTCFWKERFAKYNVDIYGDPFEEVRKLPILSKKEVQEFYKDIRNTEYQGPVNQVHTSGTTGAGLIFWESRNAEAQRWAIWWRYRHRHGLTRKTWCGYFGGRSFIPLNNTTPPYHRINYSSNQILFSAYHLKEETCKNYIEALNKYKPEWLHGYPSFLTELASIAESQNVFLDYKPKSITIGAENLSLFQKRKIERFYGVSPVQHYGMAESIANFSQVPESSSLIVDEDFSYVEFINVDGQLKIVGTNFTNSVFPLFRYDVGDVASGVDESVFPRSVNEVDGRAEDVIKLPTGERIGRLDHVFKDAIYIEQAQIIQKELSKIVVNLVVNSEWSAANEKRLLEEFISRLGKDIDIEFCIVKTLKKTKSGKLRFVISEL